MIGSRYDLSTLRILLGGLRLSLSRRPVLEWWTQQDRPGKGPGEAESVIQRESWGMRWWPARLTGHRSSRLTVGMETQVTPNPCSHHLSHG